MKPFSAFEHIQEAKEDSFESAHESEVFQINKILGYLRYLAVKKSKMKNVAESDVDIAKDVNKKLQAVIDYWE